MLERAEEHGDLFAPVAELKQELRRRCSFPHEMVDWSLARQVARLAAGADEPAGRTTTCARSARRWRRTSPPTPA